VTWRNAFAPTPLCCPSRASFLTGEYTHNHGVMSHNDPWGYQLFDDSRTLATALQAAGYRTGYVGKYLNGFGADVPRAAPERTDSYTFVPNGWTDWRAAVDETPYPESDPRHGSTYDYFHLTLDVNGELVGHPGRYSSDVLADNAVDMLDGFTAAPDPWFLMVNSTAPHHGAPREPDDPGPVYAASGQLEPMVTPARPEWVKGKFDDVIRRGPGLRPDGTTEADVSDKMNQTRVRTELDDAERASVLEAARQRAEALFALDRALGRVFDRLRDSGELDRTILVFTTDNGYLLGEHRWREGKVVGYEPSYRIPMLMAGPGVPANENRYSPISMIDLTSTILDWADARLADTDGRSVVADVAADRGWTTPIGYEALLAGVHRSAGVPGFPDARTSIGIRTARYAYLRYINGQVELFDLARDPLELESVAGDPAYANVRRELWRLWNGLQELPRRRLPPPAAARPADLAGAHLRAAGPDGVPGAALLRPPARVRGCRFPRVPGETDGRRLWTTPSGCRRALVDRSAWLQRYDVRSATAPRPISGRWWGATTPYCATTSGPRSRRWPSTSAGRWSCSGPGGASRRSTSWRRCCCGRWGPGRR